MFGSWSWHQTRTSGLVDFWSWSWCGWVKLRLRKTSRQPRLRRLDYNDCGIMPTWKIIQHHNNESSRTIKIYSGNHIWHKRKQLQTPYAVLFRLNSQGNLRIQHFIPLLSALSSLNPFLVHLLGHLLVSLLFFLGGSSVFDCLDVSLH